jgi:hypothetical protein
MGAIPGVKFTIMRTIAMLMNLIAIILTLSMAGLGIASHGENPLMILGPIIGVVLFGLCIKLEIDAIDAHRPIFLIVSIVIAVVLEIILTFVLTISWNSFGIFYLPLIGAGILLVICWHYTLSIYKNEKKRFIVAGIGYLGLWIGFGYSLVALLILVPTILVVAAMVMTLVAEQKLKQKKLLNYI